MEGSSTLIFFSFTMLIGSLVSGILPMALSLSEAKMRLITVLGAGLLIGTALAVIVPEGIHSLYAVPEVHQDHLALKDIHHAEKRNVNDNRNFEMTSQYENIDIMKLAIEKNNPTHGKIILKRQVLEQAYEGKKEEKVNNKLQEASKVNEEHSHDHNEKHHAHGTEHSGIGISLVLGFIFMLVIDNLGAKIGHGHSHSHQLLDSSIRNKVTFTTTLGLVVHAAADGVALGAAAASQKSDVEMIVFFAIMLHKAPASFGLVSFLIHEGLEKSKIRRHLIIFALSAPVMAIFTYIFLISNIVTLPPESTGYCMLFSAGTFLYVSTVHVLPEVQSHNEDRQFNFFEMLSFIIGAIMPLFLAMGHHH